MQRKVYIENDLLSLAEYIPSDLRDRFDAWCDPETESGYNSRQTKTFEEFAEWKMRQRWHSTIIRKSDGACVGMIMLSPDDCEPDLAIIIYPKNRFMGYGTAAFALGVEYAFSVLKLPEVHAGCYEDNSASLNMLKNCGFEPLPAGDRPEKHYLTGADRVQCEFVKRNPSKGVAS